MENMYFSEVKKLIEVHKTIQDRNTDLLEIIQTKTDEIERLKDNEQKLKHQVKEALQSIVNVADMSSKYAALKNDYSMLLHEKKLLEDSLRLKEALFAAEKDEILQSQEKHIIFYNDMVNKEQQKYVLKEREFAMELKRTTNLMGVQLEQTEQKWKVVFEDVNRKLKESNISCNNLRSQLHQMNQRVQNTYETEKRVRELEHKLDFKENELRLAQQELYSKGRSPSYSSPQKHLYRANGKKCTYRTNKQVKSASRPQSIVDDEDSGKYGTLNVTISGKGDVVDTSSISEGSGNVRKFKKRKLFDPSTFEYPIIPDNNDS